MQYHRPPDRRPMSAANKLAIFVIVLVILGGGAASVFFNPRGSNRFAAALPSQTPEARLPSASEIISSPEPDISPTPAVYVTPEPTAEPLTPEPNFYMTPMPTDVPTLKLNSSGEEVRAVQKRLIELGYMKEGADDAQYGKGTQNAVKAFQSVNGLGADGAAGPKTLTVLFSTEAKAKP